MKKIIIYSGESMKETHDRLKKLADKMEGREDRSMVRSMWNVLTKKPVIGKPREKKNEK